jgi:hypothetical protein
VKIICAAFKEVGWILKMAMRVPCISPDGTWVLSAELRAQDRSMHILVQFHRFIFFIPTNPDR